MNIGNLVKTIRTARGVSQKSLSNKLGISTNYLCLLENSKRNPSGELIKKIADEFDVSYEALEFLCTETPQELDEEHSKTYTKLQENIASLIVYKKHGA